MKTMTISLTVLLLLTSVIMAQRPTEIETLRADMLAVLTGDVP